jgi:hypothetical protein
VGRKLPDHPVVFYHRLVKDGLDNIFHAVDATEKGMRKRNYSADVNREQALQELWAAYQHWVSLLELDSKRRTEKKTQSIQSVANTTRRLRGQLLESGKLPDGAAVRYLSYPARMIAARFSSQDEFNTILAGLDQLIACAEHCANPKYVGFRLQRSPVRWFVSEILPGVYERIFGRRARKRSGPYIRLAVAVMKEMGEPISTNTVTGAMIEADRGWGPGYRDPERRKKKKSSR